MRAAYYERQGPADEVLRIGDFPLPQPRRGEVRVRICASGINPADWKARGGTRGEGIPPLKVIPHYDGAGTIEAVGPGVPDRTGERVWLWNDVLGKPLGTAAEQVVVPGSRAIALPDNIGFAEGACLEIPALTALRAIQLARLAPGARALVAGGAGAVGELILQILRARGIESIALASTGEKAERARRAGAAHAIRYTCEDIAAQCALLTGRRGVDCFFDLDMTTNATLYPLVVRPRGSVVIFGTSAPKAHIPAHAIMRASIRLLPFLVFDIPTPVRSRLIAELQSLMTSGKVRPSVGRIFLLEEIAAAHRLAESGTNAGNIVLAFDPACEQFEP